MRAYAGLFRWYRYFFFEVIVHFSCTRGPLTKRHIMPNCFRRWTLLKCYDDFQCESLFLKLKGWWKFTEGKLLWIGDTLLHSCGTEFSKVCINPDKFSHSDCDKHFTYRGCYLTCQFYMLLGMFQDFGLVLGMEMLQGGALVQQQTVSYARIWQDWQVNGNERHFPCIWNVKFTVLEEHCLVKCILGFSVIVFLNDCGHMALCINMMNTRRQLNRAEYWAQNLSSQRIGMWSDTPWINIFQKLEHFIFLFLARSKQKHCHRKCSTDLDRLHLKHRCWWHSIVPCWVWLIVDYFHF